MIDELEVEDFLEHFGVKGMHWGVRNKFHKFQTVQKRRKLNKYGDKNIQPLTPAQKKARSQRNAERVVLGARVAAGLAFAGIFLAARAQEKASAKRMQDAFSEDRFKDAFRNARGNAGEGARRAASTARGARSAKDIINSERGKQSASLLRMHQEGKMDAEQYKNFLKILNTRYDRKISDLG